MLMFIKHR